LEMELELGLALPGSDRTPEPVGVHGEKRASLCRKRGVDEMLGKATLPLFIRKDNDEDGDDDGRQSKHLQELNLDGHVADGEESDAAYYKVTYEDEDGDWMLVGDVPWELSALKHQHKKAKSRAIKLQF
ncbi:hypothetical protein B296_00019855, partial [Ensete ventricosum]